MRIQVISTMSENVPTANGGYNKLTVTFKNLDSGKVEVKSNIMDFKYPDVFNRLKDAAQNDLFQVKLEKVKGKDGKDYWTWTGVDRDDGTAPEPVASNRQSGTPAVSAPATRGSTYETAEERALRQLLIVRQSSLAQAVLFVKDQGKKPTLDEVLELATKFDEWVWNKGVAGMSSDIPE